MSDYLVQYGGAERVLEVLCEIFPDAPIYTLIYDERATGGVFREKEIHTSFLQKLPLAKRHHRLFPALMPIAVEQFDLSYFDVVLSVSASFAKGIITKPHTKHINYCLTPTRFLWDDSHRYIDEFKLPWPIKRLIPFFITYLRIWDKEASLRVDKYVGISSFVRERIKKYYEQDSDLIYPPVKTGKYFISENLGDYFLMVGRLVSYKRFELAVKAFSAMGIPLKIAGDGPERKRLEKITGGNIEFLGLVSDYRMPDIYSRAQALIFPQEEDFGLVALESMASGRPVIAYRGGGALETVVEGKTGIFFNDQSEIAISLAVGEYFKTKFDPEFIREHAKKFDVEVFKKKIVSLVANK
ncbi:MAG: group 1 glycosyl transferase [Parcubacteria group bacterium Licking1014_17]|nr:MAG: group 1 glycosyl transferase [Parcubacteria group bacterium Licking1014_17]